LSSREQLEPIRGETDAGDLNILLVLGYQGLQWDYYCVDPLGPIWVHKAHDVDYVKGSRASGDRTTFWQSWQERKSLVI
jgi:hypothetical protein